MQVNAAFYDGRSALAHPVVCVFPGAVLEARTPEGQVLAAWPRDGILAGAAGRPPLRLRYAGDQGARLVVSDAHAVSLLSEWLAPVIARRRAKTRFRWLAGTAAVWALLALFWFGAPVAVNLVTHLVPYSWERNLGGQTRDVVGRYLSGTYTGPVPWIASGPGHEALQAMVKRLADADPGSRYDFQVSILDADLVNAFALPGGFIVTTTGLIRQCRSPDELAGVIAHEMGHVTERHNTRQLVREQFYSFAGKVLTGGSDVMEMVNSAGRAFISSKFSREDEREADILGVSRLASAGIDPTGIARFFAGLPQGKNDAGRFAYLDSHPLLSDRQEYMKREAARYPGPFTPALDDAGWRSLKTLAAKKRAK